MVGKQWKFVKKTFNVLGIAKAAQPKSSSHDDNDDSHNSDVDVELEVKKPSSQPITNYERARSKKDQYRRLKKDRAAETKEKAVKPKSKTKLVEPDRLERAKARREELQEYKKRTEEDVFLCKSLGMDTNGMCLRHPNQLITTLGPTFEEVHRCRICDSESQMGSKAPRQRKSMANVIDQVKAMQADRDDWRKRTKVMFWTSKQELDFDNDDEEALDEKFALTKEEWEEQVTARVTQVVAWRDENQLQAHPIFSRYFTMLEMGVPIAAAKNACQMDGYNPDVLDLDPAKPLKTQIGKFDKKTRLKLEALADLKVSQNGDEENLDVPELVTRVSVSFQKQMARDMLEAVQTIDALSEKAKKKRKSKAKGEKSKLRDSTSKEKKKETTTNDTGGDPILESPKKKKTKRDSSKKDIKATKGESTKTADKKKKKRKSSRKSSAAKQSQEGSEDGTMGDNAEQAAKIAELNRALEDKDKEIQSLKEQLRQKDTIIQRLCRRTATVLRQKSNELGSPTRQCMSSSEHAVIAPVSDDDDTATPDDGLHAPNVEFQLPGYDFQTGRTNSKDGSRDGSESFVQGRVVALHAGREHDGDESINSDGGSVTDVRDNANVVVDASGDDDDKSSASDVITTEDDTKLLWLGRDDTLRTNPSHHELNPDPKEKSDPETKDRNAGDGVETPRGDKNATSQESEDSDSDEKEGQDDSDESSNGSENYSESGRDENDEDDEEEVWLSDLEGEGTERSNDSDASDEEEP